MTDTDDNEASPIIVLPPPRPKYDRTIKLLLALTACLSSVALAALLVYVAPTSKSNADAVLTLVRTTAKEKEQDACYDQYSADVTDGNAAVLAALASGQAAIGDLVVALAAQPRVPTVIQADIDAVAQSVQQTFSASKAYNDAIEARKRYVIHGRPLPCTNLPN